MTPAEFLRTLYLGDRALKAIILDSWNTVVRLQINCISRIRSESGTWDYYTEEDITDGFLVFTGVKSFKLRNEGYLPNDSINSLDIVGHRGDAVLIEMSVGSVQDDGQYHETSILIECLSLHLQDPSRTEGEIYA